MLLPLFGVSFGGAVLDHEIAQVGTRVGGQLVGSEPELLSLELPRAVEDGPKHGLDVLFALLLLLAADGRVLAERVDLDNTPS